MRIVDYELYTVPPRWQFLRLETADGLVGWGEPYTKWHTLADSEPATTAAVDQLMRKYVLDADPSRISDLWEAMYEATFFRGGPVHMSALAGIDEALWDLKGKRYGAPVYELLGGPTRDRIQCYQHVHGEDAEALAADAREQVDAGFSVLKTSRPFGPSRSVDTPATVAATVERVEAIREAVGETVDLGADFHGRVSKPMVKRLARALEPSALMFLEEPVPPEYNEFLPRLAAATETPIATGERMYSRTEFKPLLEAGGVDVIQPDVSNAGGITESLRIATMADAYDVALAPHCPTGPVSLAAAFHVDAAAPNTLVQEQTLHRNDDWRDYVENPGTFELEDGFVALPDGPGLGVEVDEDALRAREGESFDYQRPVWRTPDGAVTGQ
jgi:galactonate dehydratase